MASECNACGYVKQDAAAFARLLRDLDEARAKLEAAELTINEDTDHEYQVRLERAADAILRPYIRSENDLRGVVFALQEAIERDRREGADDGE